MSCRVRYLLCFLLTLLPLILRAQNHTVSGTVTDKSNGETLIGCTIYDTRSGKVKIKDLEYNEELEYKIVGSTEANSLQGKISNESPVGKALIGAKKGATITVETQAGVFKYKVLSIEKAE